MEHGREMNSERVLVPSDEWVRVSVCAHVCSVLHVRTCVRETKTGGEGKGETGACQRKREHACMGARLCVRARMCASNRCKRFLQTRLRRRECKEKEVEVSGGGQRKG